MSDIEEKLRITGKQVFVVADLYRAGVFGDITPAGVSIRLGQLPVGERPEDWGAIRAGGSTVWLSAEAAAKFAEHHIKYWTKRMEIPRLQRRKGGA